MCGRTGCTLNAGDVRRACSYKDRGRYRQPTFHDNGQVYKPSHNFCPTDTCLVLIAGSHVDSKDERVLVPMIWGMIPPWHVGESFKNHGLTTHNCRLEGVWTSRLYGRALTQGRRCVILCNGFYEWQTTKGKGNKMPYFIYNKQPEGVGPVDNGTWSWSEKGGWSGPTLLRIAGLFDTWRSTKGEELYSCSMITCEADETLSWLHHRQPAFLETDEQVAAWLDGTHVTAKEALQQLKSPKNLCWYPVSTLVNNCHNKDPACSQPLKPDSPTKSCKSTLMSLWLQKGTPKKQTESDPLDHKDIKRIKLDESYSKKVKETASEATNNIKREHKI